MLFKGFLANARQWQCGDPSAPLYSARDDNAGEASVSERGEAGARGARQRRKKG